MKKGFWLLLLLFSFQVAISFDEELNNESDGYTRDLDDEDWDNDLDLFEGIDMSSSPLSRATPAGIVALLEAIGVNQLLEEDFFLHTNDLNKRPLVDLPIFEIRWCSMPCHGWIIGADLFFNQTHRMNFTRNSTRLCSYLGLAQPTLINALENIIDQTVPLFDQNFKLNVPLIFDIASQFGVEERRAGFMFHFLHQTDCGQLFILLPFFYQERNFILTDCQRKLLESQFEPGDPAEQEKFQNQHFISDKVGFGDLRLEIDSTVANWNESIIRLGVVATLPTAWALKKGLRGRDFPRPSCQPNFNLNQLFDLAEGDITSQIEQQAFTLLSNFLIGSLDRLAAAVLDNELGNRHHLRLGILARTYTPLSSILDWPGAACWSFFSRTSFEYVFTAHEPRFFIKRNPPEAFRLRDFSSDAQAAENLAFLQEAFVNKFYPIALRTNVQPGVIFRWTSRFCYEGCWFGANVGTDLWIQSRESFVDICALPNDRRLIDRPAAQKPFGYQTKLYGGLLFRWQRETHAWVVSLNGDGTIASAGMGKDFTLALNIESYF